MSDYLIRKGAYWYRPNAQGYTANVNEAGLFTYEDAVAYTHPNGPDGSRDGLSYIHRNEVQRPKQTICPFEIKPRGGYRGLLGGLDPEEEKEIGYYESDSDWIDANREACIWFLTQIVGDPCNEK